MSLSLRLRAERKNISEQMRALLTSTSPNAAEQWRNLDNAQEELRKKIEATELDGIERDLSNNRANVNRPNIGTEELTPNQSARSTASYRRDFDKWIRGGRESAELRALGDASGQPAAVLVPQGFQEELEIKMKSFAGLRQAARILKTDTGNPIPWPIMDDTSNAGEFLAEAAATTSADPTFSSVTLTSNLVSSKLVKISVQLAQDSAFNMGAELLNAFAIRLSRATEPTFLTGTGSGQPTGLLTALATAGVASVQAIGANANSGNAGDTNLNSLGSTDFSSLVDALDPNYRPTASFMANASTFGRLRRTLDKYGRPVWSTSLQTGDSDKVFGHPFYYNQQMSGIGAGNVSLIFGDFSKYIIRDSLGVTLVRFNELYMANYQIGFQAFIRVDGQLLQPAAFAYMRHSLS